MTSADYIKNLNKLKNLSLSRWNKLGFENDVIEEAYNWLLDHLNIKRGTPQADEELTRAMDSFLNAVVNIISENKTYQGKISSFLSDLTTIYKNQKRFYATSHNFNIETAGVKEAQKTAVNEIVNQYTKNGLNPHFASPLRDNIYRNILAGANMKEVKQVLNAYILGGQDQSGKLGSYLTQTAQQAVDSYTGMINQKLQEEFTFTGYIISGSLIETSSKQCVYAVENSKRGYMPFSDWETVLDIARNNKQAKLIEGTTIKNLPLNKLHWGCRHDFTPIIVEEPKKKESK